MLRRSIWLTGPAQSGKTYSLCLQLQDWLALSAAQLCPPLPLVLAANEEGQRQLGDRLADIPQNRFTARVKTPLAWIRDEVLLCWPLILLQTPITEPFPLLLNPETEQELALAFWQQQGESWPANLTPAQQNRLLRDALDLIQLAAAAGLPLSEIGLRQKSGYGESLSTWPQQGLSFEQQENFLQGWRQWCWQKGFLTYGLLLDLFGQYLLPQAEYQQSLLNRYQALFADDLEDYPALMADLLKILQSQLPLSVFTFDDNSSVRWGLNADPHYCRQVLYPQVTEVVVLESPPSLAKVLGPVTLNHLHNPQIYPPLPTSITSIQTLNRASLLRTMSEVIIQEVQQGHIAPQEIAIIAPGLDEIARYTLLEILTKAGLPINPLNEQRPLNSSPLIRAFLTLLALLYPGLGGWVRQDDVAEMLILLSCQPPGEPFVRLVPQIDPVRAGLLATTCFHPDPNSPRLLPFQAYSQWHRFGDRSSRAYQKLYDWVLKTQGELKPHTPPREVLERAMDYFLPPLTCLNEYQLADLQAFVYALEHYEQVQTQLWPEQLPEASQRLAGFLKLLRQSTITANPRLYQPFRCPQPAITLATIYQYRSLRQRHRWHFWLDAGDLLWEKGGASQLFAAPLFQRLRPKGIWGEDEERQQNQTRFEHLLRDLLARVEERLILCHSEFSIRGTEQLGPLLPWIEQVPERLK